MKHQHKHVYSGKGYCRSGHRGNLTIEVFQSCHNLSPGRSPYFIGMWEGIISDILWLGEKN